MNYKYFWLKGYRKIRSDSEKENVGNQNMEYNMEHVTENLPYVVLCIFTKRAYFFQLFLWAMRQAMCLHKYLANAAKEFVLFYFPQNL